MRNQCIVQLLGRNRIWIENYRGITKYSSEEVKIQTEEGIIQILGQNLMIEYYSNEELEHIFDLLMSIRKN